MSKKKRIQQKLETYDYAVDDKVVSLEDVAGFRKGLGGIVSKVQHQGAIFVIDTGDGKTARVLGSQIKKA